MGCYQKALHVNVCCFCLYLLHFWLDIVFLSILEGEHFPRLERAVYRDLHDLSATVPRVNLPILTSIAVCHTHQHFWWAIYLQNTRNTVYMLSETCQNCCVFVEWERIVCLNISFAKGRWNVFELSQHNVLYTSVYLQVKLQC